MYDFKQREDIHNLFYNQLTQSEEREMYKEFERQVKEKYPQLSLEREGACYTDSMTQVLFEGFGLRGALVEKITETATLDLLMTLSNRDKLIVEIAKLVAKVVTGGAKATDLVDLLDKKAPKKLLEAAMDQLGKERRSQCDCRACSRGKKADDDGAHLAILKALEGIFGDLDDSQIHVVRLQKK